MMEEMLQGRIWNEDKGEWVNRPPINESLNVSRMEILENLEIIVI